MTTKFNVGDTVFIKGSKKMIIEIPNDNSIVKWKKTDKDEWKVAEISDLINTYEADRWISVSERLPDKDGVYLVTLEYVEDSEIVNEIDMAKFVYSEKDDCNDGFHKAYTVIAWRPLPEVYMEGL